MTDRRRYLFTDRATSNRCFSAAALVKKQVAATEVVDTDTGEIVDLYSSRGGVTYYRFTDRPVLPPEAVCVDIKAAYPTTLLNLHLIDEKGHRALMSLPKRDRLKAVGMLAATRYVQHFEHGLPVGHMEKEDSATRWAFFALCERVGEVMETLRDNLGERFLFFWVDGMFMHPDAVPEARAYLHAAGYETTAEPVTALRWSPSRKYVFYTKNGKATYLCIPQRSEFDATQLLSTLAADALNVG